MYNVYVMPITIYYLHLSMHFFYLNILLNMKLIINQFKLLFSLKTPQVTITELSSLELKKKL